MEKRLAISLPRSQSPECGRTNRSPTFGGHSFAQDIRSGSDVVQKEIAVGVKFLVTQCFWHTKGSAIHPLALLRRDKLGHVAGVAADGLEHLEPFLDLLALPLRRWQNKRRR